MGKPVRPRPVLVAIVGGSGAGKSWLGDKLAAALKGKAGRLSLDDFYRDRSHLSPARRAAINFDRPSAIDWPRVEQVLAKLQAGKTASVPRYDFTTHTRLARDKVVTPRAVMLVDGLWLFHRASLRRLFEMRIYVDCPKATRLRRRIERDVRVRGRTRRSVVWQFRRTVEPSHLKYVAPQSRWATLVCNGENTAGLVREIAKLLTVRAGSA